MQKHHSQLHRSLALAQSCLYPPPGALALEESSGQDDPLRLNLPALFNGGVLPTPQAVRVLAALYLQAELEEAGVIPLAETLAAQRSRLDQLGLRAAQKLENFALHARDWYDRPSRQLLFARLFGMGPAANRSDERAANHDFQQRLAMMCYALIRYAQAYEWGALPGAQREASLRMTCLALLSNLGPRQFGNTLIAGRQIQAQLQLAIDLLDDEQIEALFQSRNLWDTLRKAFGPVAPDIQRLVTRGQSGERLLAWLAEAMPRLSVEESPSDPTPARTPGWLASSPPAQPEQKTAASLVPPGSPVFNWAAAWLQASGLRVNSPERLPAF
jgi:hypothetical protein